MKPSEVLIYLRKSRTDDPSLSVAETLSRHEQMLDEFALRVWGESVPEQNRFREVVSGETIEARPEIQKVLRLIEQPCYRAVLVVEPQRLSRGDLEDIGRLSKLLRFTGTRVITLQYSYDLTDARDRDYFERELKRGNEYLEYQKRIMGNGREASVSRGNYLGTTAPYGYRRCWVKVGKKKEPTLEIDPVESETVRLIFRMYAAGQGASAICRSLNAQGIPTRSASEWRLSTIYQMLDNPVYVGMVRWRSTRETRVVSGGEIEKHRLKQEEYPLFPGRHEAIIEQALWDAVRARREAHDLPRVHTVRQLKNPFAGLVRCSCGGAVVLLASNPNVAPRLRCVNRHVCGTASCRYQDFVETVIAALKENLADLETPTGSATAINNHEEIERLQRRVQLLEKKEASIWEKYVEDMPRAIFEELLEKTKRERRETDALLAAEMERSADSAALAARTGSLHEALDLLADIDAVPAKAANKLLKACIRQITYRRDTATKQSGGNRGGWNSSPIELDIELAF